MNLRFSLGALAAAAIFHTCAAAQCNFDFRENFNGSPTTDDDICLQRSFVFTNPEAFPIRVCQASVRIRDGGCGGAQMRIEVRDVLPGGAPGALEHTSPTLDIPSSLAVRTAIYTNNVVIEPGESKHFVINYLGTNPCGLILPTWVDTPAATNGTNVESWVELQQSGVQFWTRADKAIMYRIDYMPWVVAQREHFGAGCGNSVPCGTTPSRSLNWNGNPLSGSMLSNRRAFQVRDTFGYPTRDVCRLDIRTGAFSGQPAPVRVSIFDDQNNSPGSEIATTVLMVQPGGPQLHPVQFPNPARIGPGQHYWIVFEPLGAAVFTPAETFGNPQPTAVWNGQSWQSTSLTANWSTRIYWSQGLSQIPRMIGDTAVLAEDFTPRMVDAPANAPCVLMTGWSNPDLDLGFLGAPGCRAYSSAEVLATGLTNAIGRADATYTMPSDPSLLDFEIFQQWAVLAPFNSLGLSFTNGVRLEVGSY